jgi:histidinol-phosphatase (PHP family)
MLYGQGHQYTRKSLETLCRRDLHIHTPYCNHAAGRMEDYVRTAVEIGLEEIGFLAHAEQNIRHHRRSWLLPEQLDQYWEEGQQLRARYEGLIRVSLGLEMGLNPAAVPALQQLIRRHPWDRVGMSYHYLENVPPRQDRHSNICSSHESGLATLPADDVLNANLTYYEGLRRHVPVFRPDFLCHLDVIRRYMPDRSDDPVVRAAVHALLDVMAHHDTALEINTSGYFHGEICPSPWIIRAAARRDIRFVFCSDSHHPDHVGRFFARAVADVLNALADTTDQ